MALKIPYGDEDDSHGDKDGNSDGDGHSVGNLIVDDDWDGN